MKFDVLRFALASGIVGALVYAWTTVASILTVPGFFPFAQLLEAGYGSYGYSISWLGVLVGAVYGFIEGFVWLGAVAWIYNKLSEKKRK